MAQPIPLHGDALPGRRVVVEQWTADHRDKALVASMVHELGFDPNAVGELSVTVSGGELKISVTRLASHRRR